jgi:MFS transporter, Spinster family, sphingosine-1-phosphate transporter
VTRPTELPNVVGEIAADEILRPTSSGTAQFAWHRHRNYVLFMMFIMYFLNALDRNIINILQQSIKEEFHLMDWQLGVMTGFAFALFFSIIGIMTARLIDSGALRTTILAAGLALWSVATALCGFAQNYWQLLFSRGAVGVGEGTFGPSVVTLISDYFGRTERARAIGIYQLGLPVASLIGFSAGGWIAHRYGWRAALLMVGLPGLIVALIIKVTVKEPPRGLSDGKLAKLEAALSIRQVFMTVTKKKTVVHLLAAASLASFSTVGGIIWLPSFLQRAFGLNAGQVGATWGIVAGLTGMVASFGGGWLVDRFGARNPKYFMLIPALAMAICLPFHVLAMLSGNFWLCIALLIVPATLNTSWFPSALSSTQGLAPLAMRALLSMFVAFVSILVGQGIAPPAIGALSDLLGTHMGNPVEGLRWALIAAGIFYPWSALHFWLASRSIQGDLED